MPSPGLSIMVVDDTKFSSVMIGRALNQVGYDDVRYASTGSEALELLRQRPAQLLLADWLMPEMDGLALTSQVRGHDQQSGNYTYVVLLTGREGSSALAQAFEQGVDDFISKSDMNEQLIPRVRAAERLYRHLQALQHKNASLLQNLQRLQAGNTHDPLTRLGNQRSLLERLDKSLKQLEARGGVLGLLLFNIDNMAALRDSHGVEIQKQLLRTVGQRLEHLVRPLDHLARLDGNEFALITLMEPEHNYNAGSYKRLHDALNLKPCRTSAGYFHLETAISMVTLDASTLPVSGEHLVEQARANLAGARSRGRITHLHLGPARP